MKCKICGKTIEETFLKKIKGTFIQKKPVCRQCQKDKSADELKAALA